MKKIIVFVVLSLLCLLISIPVISQEKGLDTMHLKSKDLKFCFEEFERLTLTGGKYYYNGKEIDSFKYVRTRKFVDSICHGLFEVAAGKYCKFYNKDSIVVLEGIWNPEFFKGPYKEYYNNGKIKTEGEYSTIESEYGTKTGKWVYYKKSGRVIKTINYPK